MLLAVMIALSPAIVVAPPAKSVAGMKPICRNPGIVVADAARAAGIHPLGNEPPAQHLKAVVREIDGCNTPMVVSAQVGTPGR